ncbi:MAG: ABC transporter ATP-binding protein [Dehalococcoidia bacterium]|nr:ABC transporter ATP-binding protein [Dehalococcoidia bacterium]
MLQVNDIYASYGLAPVLQGVSLYVNRGEIVVITGPHGSGKSTALRAICGILAIARGEVLFAGHQIQGLPIEKTVGRGMAYVDENRLVFPSMSVMDNLILGTYSRRGKEKRNRTAQNSKSVFQLFPVLEERKKQAAGTLSGGEKQMLMIARALMSNPELLLLDCPSMGLAPLLVSKVMNVILKLKGQGMGVLLVEQDIPAALDIADRGYVIERGRVVSEIDSRELSTGG